MKAVARLFYPNELSKKWIESLTAVAAKKHGEQAALTRFMKDKGSNLLFMRDMRNMIEHPQADAYVTWQNPRTARLSAGAVHVRTIRAILSK